MTGTGGASGTRLHPLSIPYRAGTRIVEFGWALVLALFGASSGLVASYRWYAIGAVALLVLAVLAYQVAEYRRFQYALTAETLDIDSGVLSRREREIPLGRVQNVDVSQNVVQRVLGIATVNVETAGGGETEAVLACVSTEEAERLQREIRRRKRALEGDGDEETEAGEPEPTGAETPDEVVFELDDRSLFLVSVLSFDPRLASVVFGAQPFIWPVLAPMLESVVSGLSLAVLVLAAAAVTLVGVVLLWTASAARTFARYYGFRLTRDGDDLRYERGLLQRYSGTIPLEKLQTLVVTENVLMRRYGYAALRVETAGYAPGSGSSGGSATVVPLADREAVFALGQRLEPFEVPEFERPPARARRRYLGRYALAVAGLLAVTTLVDQFVVAYPLWWTPALLFALVPVAAHYKYVNLGYAATENHAFARRGFFARHTHVVPYYRVQTVVRRATVFQRRWGLADVVVDTAGSGGGTSGDAVVQDIDAERAAGLADGVADRLRTALRERVRARRERNKQKRNGRERREDGRERTDQGGVSERDDAA
ncbi:PH domain-containing protein [Halocalculus aciditolerans]|uniref:Membrane protein n=1 Tax=Halocalculus aciditolerans TaxID=1383812 RepID=A0A830FIL1_9EURY|nr:PH domain-containing protein [Halocalculus aciditolerans]GGL56420.1 membrane protein [Halocalculus aciditolerans]